MSKLSPYRQFPAARRVQLVTHAIASSREARSLYVDRLVARGRGFRAVTLKGWSPDRLAAEVVRTNAENSHDELELLQLHYVDLEPAIQITFLDAAGVEHDNGRMGESLEPPYANTESVVRGAAAVLERHGADGVHYLRTIARYGLGAWPGIETVIAALDAQLPASGQRVADSG